jgi:serine phosphatase RsbU (regulator of sigma subunit)
MKKIFLLFLLLPFIVQSQTKEIDSLFVIARNESVNDSLRMNAYVDISKISLSEREFTTLKTIYSEAFSIAEQSNNNHYYAAAINFLGIYYLVSDKVNYDSAEVKLSQALDYLSSEKSSRLKGLIYNNLSAVNNLKSELEKAKYFAEKEAEVGKELNDLDLQNRALQLLSGYYQSIGNYSEMLAKNNEALKLARESNDSARIILSMIQIGQSYGLLNQTDNAIEIFESILKDYKSKVNKMYKQIIYTELGLRYKENRLYIKALENYYEGFDHIKNESYYGALNRIASTYIELMKAGVPDNEIPRLIEANESKLTKKVSIEELTYTYIAESIDGYNQLGGEDQIIKPLYTLAEFHLLKSDYKSAITSYKRAWKVAKKNDLLLEQNEISYELYLLSKKQNNTEETLKWHERYVESSDSLSNQENQQEIGRQLAEFEYSNIKIADSLEQIKKDEIQQIKIAQQEKNIENEQQKKYFLYGGLVITLLLLIFLFRRFNITKKQKLLIELQKSEMEKKQIELSKTHLEIKDSINYSKRIQRSIFPSKKDIDSIFLDNFTFFKPKDVVSGDFYWCIEAEGKKIFVLGDCTGHGVPGAFMTIIGINILKEIIQGGVTDSAIILKEINAKLKSRLGQNEEKVKDGMDLGICIIDDQNIEYSGAHLPLYHISDHNFTEFKGSNTFLGSEDQMDNLKTHHIKYKKGDQIYMATDGFPDQRGGEKGKKYFYNPFRELLLKNSTKTMSEQHDLLKKEFENWVTIGNKTQMDDVSIIGIKL